MIRNTLAIVWLSAALLPTCALAATADVKVMSFNVWSAEESSVTRPYLIDTIRQSGADIIGFQEMTPGALSSMAATLGYYHYDQQLGSEAIMSRYRIIGNTPNRYGVLVELAPGHEAWIFNTHLFHAPYGPYQLNGIAYVGGRLYDPAVPANITSVVNDQIAARGVEMQAVLQAATATGALSSGQPVFLTGDFNEASHLDWTAAADAAGVHAAAVPWPASLATTAAGFKDSFREVYPNEVTHPGRTWSPVYPSTYLNTGDNPAVQPQPILEPQDRIDFVYYAGTGVTAIDSKRSGPPGGDVAEELEIANYPSDHNSVTSTFRVTGLDDTTLTFTAPLTPLIGQPIPAGYGSRVLSSPNVALALSAAGGLPNDRPIWKAFNNTIWPSGVAHLDSGNGQQAIGAAFSMLLAPDAGFGVALDSFSLLDYDDGLGQGHSVRWELLGNGAVLASGLSAVPANGQLPVITGLSPFFDGPLELRLTHLSGFNNDLAIDDILFRQVVIPEPATILLAVLGLIAFCFTFRSSGTPRA